MDGSAFRGIGEAIEFLFYAAIVMAIIILVLLGVIVYQNFF
jgi:hypothetical protein